MTDDVKQQTKKGKINPVSVGVAGAVVGAGVGVAGALAMQDEGNRKKVKETLAKVKNKAMSYVKDVRKGLQDQAVKQMHTGEEKVKTIIEKPEKASRSVVKKAKNSPLK